MVVNSHPLYQLSYRGSSFDSANIAIIRDFVNKFDGISSNDCDIPTAI